MGVRTVSTSHTGEWKEIVERYVALKKDIVHMSNELQKVEGALKAKCRAGDLMLYGHTMAVRTRRVNCKRVEFLIIDGERQ